MLNVVALLGRLTADPELRQTPQGTSVTRFTLAVDRNYAKPGTERQTDFIDVVAWRSTAEFVCKYFKKGSLMAVDGSLQTSMYQDKDTGKNRKTTEVIANNVNFGGSKSQNGGGTTAPAEYQRPAAAEAPAAYSAGGADDFAPIDDSTDLPF